MQHKKICKMHGELNQENIIIEPNKSAKRGFTLRCKICKKIKETKYKELNRDLLAEKNKIYKANNRDIVNSWEKEDRKKNPEKYKQYEKNYIKKHGKIKIRKMEVSRLHGLTIEQYDFLFESQCHKCKICGLEETRKGSSGDIAPLCVDHCHLCRDNGHMGLKNIRALLCHECNKALGGFKDNTQLLQNAIDYLKAHEHITDDSTGIIPC